MELNVSTAMGGDIVIIDVVGSLVASSSDQLKDQVSRLMEKRFNYILFDMSNVDFMDSSGLGACIAVHKRFSENKGMVIFAKPSSQVGKIFRITKADQKLNIAPTRHDGVKSLHEELIGASQR